MSPLARFTFLIFFLGTSASAHFSLLECRLENLSEYRHSCQTEALCGVFEDPGQQGCIDQRAVACFCLTYLGGRYFRQNDFDWSMFAIHGHYCGWRSDHRAEGGGPLNWYDRDAVRRADLATPGLDPLDEACRVHDMEYDERGMDICKADQKAIEAMLSLARNEKSPEAFREKSLILAESLELNRGTCHLLTLIKALFTTGSSAASSGRARPWCLPGSS
jgi:hypothetical protein